MTKACLKVIQCRMHLKMFTEKVQIFSYNRTSSEALMYNIVTVVNNMVLYSWELLRVAFKYFHHTHAHTKRVKYVRW